MTPTVLTPRPTTVAYQLRAIPREIHGAAVARAQREGRSLRWILIQALRAYGSGQWGPWQPREESAP